MRWAFLAVVLLVACGDDGASTTSTASTAAPTVPSTPSIPTTAAQAPRPTPAEAIDALLSAWRAGDRVAAALVADAAAIDALFAVPAEAPRARGCNEALPGEPVYCVYRLAAGELQVRAAERPGGWIVDFAIISAAG